MATYSQSLMIQIMRDIIVPHGVLEKIEGIHMECSVYEYGFTPLPDWRDALHRYLQDGTGLWDQ